MFALASRRKMMQNKHKKKTLTKQSSVQETVAELSLNNAQTRGVQLEGNDYGNARATGWNGMAPVNETKGVMTKPHPEAVYKELLNTSIGHRGVAQPEIRSISMASISQNANRFLNTKKDEMDSLKYINKYMLTYEVGSDVKILVGKLGDFIRAHAYILMARSSKLADMLKEQKGSVEKTINIPDETADSFTLYLE